MAELVYALVSEANGSNPMEVQVLLAAPKLLRIIEAIL